MKTTIERWRRNGKTLALVPTMGALHEGHLELIRRARAACDRVVVSIFVNPKQFGPGEDFARYPRDLKRDGRLSAAEKVDVVFAPSAEEMYPAGFDTAVVVNPKLTQALCGAARPGHFNGVSTVVAKLFNLIRPHQAFFGHKDYQQPLVVKRLAADLNTTLLLSGSGDILEPEGSACSIGSGAGYALAAARAFLESPEGSAEEIARRSLTIASKICIYTNDSITLEVLGG